MAFELPFVGNLALQISFEFEDSIWVGASCAAHVQMCSVHVEQATLLRHYAPKLPLLSCLFYCSAYDQVAHSLNYRHMPCMRVHQVEVSMSSFFCVSHALVYAAWPLCQPGLFERRSYAYMFRFCHAKL